MGHPSREVRTKKTELRNWTGGVTFDTHSVDHSEGKGNADIFTDLTTHTWGTVCALP
jgi:hypothetical protein